MSKIMVILVALALSGCAVAPDRLSLEVDHTSHLSQHFGDATHYGFDAAMVVAHWQVKRAYLDVGEGAVLDSCASIPYSDSAKVLPECGGLDGPRELFTARVGVVLWEKGR